MRNATVILALLAFAMPVTANPFGYLTALVPINPGSVAGAFGAQWTTTLWASNNSDSDVKIGCQTIGENCMVLAAHSTMQVGPPAGLTHPGFFIDVPYGLIPQAVAADGVAFDLRVTDSVTAPHSAGTEIPIVTPNAFGPVVLLPAVPLNGHSRLKLRVYGLVDGTAALRVTGTTSGQDLVNAKIALTGSDAPSGFSRLPSYAEVDLPQSDADGDTGVRVEIDGDAAINVWAFVSVTDDASQQFTIVTPQALQYIPLSVA